ncbi:hypothetical protein [Phytomonospora endophytica]|uniref:Formate hydrogenlyase subunit 4 n=1 Tax=Phytomonospora endophytica TaxID=714109 RepID=A0A841FPZ6_9ACTN|nr:hypothetical protein [Phytomonospora endophytica]MBB6037904.1 formate hydrogenlyase subunit 4 [Phytomonospora endophytica]GIG68804.1 hypothetical protein Pen01_50990 [Phytomonospora endophytica]
MTVRETITPRLDLLLAFMMALAAVGTAWAGFQSAKWSGVQANAYAAAGAARSEATREATGAAQRRNADIISFTAWLNALNAEIIDDPSLRPEGGYTPDRKRVSGFLFNRFRPDFRPAVDAWLATKPLFNPDAPPTPFDMPEYQLPAETVSEGLVDEADALAGTARTANQRSDNYVLTAVVFALVLLFAGLASKATHSSTRLTLMVMAAVALVGCLVTLLMFPVEV